MKALKLHFAFSDNPELVELLRMHSVQTGATQKSVVVKALEAYFSEKLENKMILSAAEKTFAEWDNSEDEIYDKL